MAAKRSARVAPDVKLRNPLHTGDKAHKRGESTLALKPGQMSPELQNRGISSPAKKD